MKILITTPFFDNLGGSELETIHTANAFASFTEVKAIDLFVYGRIDLTFLHNIFIDPKIKFIKMPVFFNNKFIRRLNKEFKVRLGLEVLPLESIYWKYKFLNNYSHVYIITKSTLSYYIPIIRYYTQKYKIVVKYTTIFFETIPEVNIKYLSQIKDNLVTSKKQEFFFKNILDLKNTSVQEVILNNEDYALRKSRNFKDKQLYDFGILARFSREKQLEDAIILIENLRDKGIESTLLIRGKGSEDNYQELKKNVNDRNLDSIITMEFESVSHDEVYDFFDRINCFLITSMYEGGPNVGLEVMAYGLPILSYDVGAMPDRLYEFVDFVAKNQRDLLEKAIVIQKYDDFTFVEKSKEMKTKYLRCYSNKTKIDYIKSFLNS